MKGEINSLMVRVGENLTPEQAEIFQFARNGHNILVTGQAGTGKSRVVNTIRDDSRQHGLKVAVICSSGIACQVYDRGVASTVHLYYGLGATDMPSSQLVDRGTSNVGVSEKIKTVDVVIWDEASMSSARMLDAVKMNPRKRVCYLRESKLSSLVSFYSYAQYRACLNLVLLCSFLKDLDTP